MTHPKNQKLSAFNSLIHRALSIPMDIDDFNNEINIIKQIAKNNGYNIRLINQLIKKHKNKKNNLNTTSQNSCKTTYICSLYTIETFNILSNVTKKYNMHEKDFIHGSGVYKTNCLYCNKYYIGQIGRSFSKRFVEHKPKITSDLSKNTNFGLHLINENHDCKDIYKHLMPIHF